MVNKKNEEKKKRDFSFSILKQIIKKKMKPFISFDYNLHIKSPTLSVIFVFQRLKTIFILARFRFVCTKAKNIVAQTKKLLLENIFHYLSKMMFKMVVFQGRRPPHRERPNSHLFYTLKIIPQSHT